MNLDLEHLSEAELMELNRRVVDRIRQLRQGRMLESMMRFEYGDTVAFDLADGSVVFARVLSFNRKSVSVVTETGTRYRVDPRGLRKVNPAQPEQRAAPPLEA